MRCVLFNAYVNHIRSLTTEVVAVKEKQRYSFTVAIGAFETT